MSDFSHLTRQQNLIGSAWCDADNASTLDVTDPATDKVIATVPNAGTRETRRAIDAAHATFPAYSTMPLGQRVALMRKLHDAILDNLDPMAAMMTAEQGKPLAEARAEVASSAAYVLWFAEEARPFRHPHRQPRGNSGHLRDRTRQGLFALPDQGGRGRGARGHHHDPHGRGDGAAAGTDLVRPEPRLAGR
jgi:acyl-CoA reductase-like NAD-dependent aldehyde dehydrogenase